MQAAPGWGVVGRQAWGLVVLVLAAPGWAVLAAPDLEEREVGWNQEEEEERGWEAGFVWEERAAVG